MKKDFLSLLDLTRAELEDVFTLADSLRTGGGNRPLAGLAAALIFQKPSLRTRVSFEVGIHQLGGYAVYLSQEGVGLGQRESVADVARLLSRYVGLIVARVFDHATLVELATQASVPVINALSDFSHPCQVLSDAYTLRQHGKLQEGVKVTFVGDGNNIVHSWLELGLRFPLHFVLATPEGYEPDADLFTRAVEAGVSRVELLRDPAEAASGADVLYTDVWTSMGQEAEAEARRKAFAHYQLNEQLLALAKPDCLVMHCLPAHRGEEVSEHILDGKHSVVFDQGENRLHVQKAVMVKLLSEHRAAAAEEREFLQHLKSLGS